jgi:hypothetical protein
VDVATVLRILKNVRNTQRSEGSHNHTEHILYDYSFVYFKFIILYCIVCGASFTTHMPKTPRLHTFVILLLSVNELKLNRFVAETLLYLLHTHI